MDFLIYALETDERARAFEAPPAPSFPERAPPATSFPERASPATSSPQRKAA